MEFLARERETLESFLPGLDEALAGMPMMDLEQHGSPGPELYRRHGGAKLERATALAFELLGGIAFVQSSEISCLFSAAHALALHPPNRSSMTEELASFLGGGNYNIK